MRAMCSTAVGQSFKNVPNDYIDVLSVNQVNAAGRGRTASDVQGEQVGMKKAGHSIDLLVMPYLLNDKLSPWAARSVNWLRGLVNPRNHLGRALEVERQIVTNATRAVPSRYAVRRTA